LIRKISVTACAEKYCSAAQLAIFCPYFSSI